MIFSLIFVFLSLDAHTPASLLKLWYRELYNPLISEHLYEECVQTEDPKEAMKIVDKLPKLHKLVSFFLVIFIFVHVLSVRLPLSRFTQETLYHFFFIFPF